MKPKFANDMEKYRFIEEKLYTAVLSDVMDEIGLKDRVNAFYVQSPDLGSGKQLQKTS